MIDPVALPDPLLVVHEGEPRADSCIVAKILGKLHADVLRMIRDLLKTRPEPERSFAFLIDVMGVHNG
ncbi:hypothetical protein [Paraburkholderia caffeinilytica]|uniref:hypothetical protein n=1 Tax=Paraburkholderia caffeinilytica TaxID=1761016 RepID=UPI003DA01BD2